MIEIHFSQDELIPIREQLKSFYQKLNNDSSDDKIPSLYREFEDILGKVKSKASGFEFMGEGIGSDIAIALKSKKTGQKHDYLTRAWRKMKNDIKGCISNCRILKIII